MIENLLLGLETALQLHNLGYAFLGVLLGNIVGVLPGIGSLAAISMVLPITYSIHATGALMLLAGLYYGTSFGGVTTAILLNLPGTPSHAVVCLEGHALARKGQGGPAIFIAMIASFIGVSVGIILMSGFSPILSDVGLRFSPADYFSLMVLGLLAASGLGTGSPLNGIASVIIGLLFGVIGTDIVTGESRFTFNLTELDDGLDLVALSMGLFGISDVLLNASRLQEGSIISKQKLNARSIIPTRSDIKKSVKPIARGSGIGSFFGTLPGTGAVISAFMAYAVEKKLSTHQKEFGTGKIEGVAAPEAANSSAEITAFIPTLTLGIPGSPTMALILGALMIQNITPGPSMINNHPEVFWGLIASFWIGNLILLVLNIPLINLWVRLLAVPYRYIFPTVTLLIAVGAYSVTNSLFNVYEVFIIGVLGFFFIQLKLEPAPMLLGFVLGPLVEENFRRALLMSEGQLNTFIIQPISGISLAITAAILVWSAYRLSKRTQPPSSTDSSI